jgi:hypothetical protein
MDFAPNPTTISQVSGDFAAEFVQLRQRPAADVIPEFYRPIRAIELEPRLAALTKDMNMRRRMIVGIDRDTISPTALEYRRHGLW